MKLNKVLTGSIVGAAAIALVLSSCSSDSGKSSSDKSEDKGNAIIKVNGGEPQNPLVPTMTNETNGGKVLDAINSKLVYYNADGSSELDLAESIDSSDQINFTVKVKKGRTFDNGEEIKAENFVKAWQEGAKASNKHLNSYFFHDFAGYNEEEDSELELEIVDDYTFNIKLSERASDFEQRLGYVAYAPLPLEAFDDLEAYGQNPASSGPYKLVEWEHDRHIKLVKNEEYKGDFPAKNDGVDFVFYSDLDAAYADLLSDNLDVLDAIPDSAFKNYESDLGDRTVNQASAVFQSFTIPQSLEHFEGEEGKLRRAAISRAINREEITKTIFEETRTPAKDFTSPVVDGYSDSVEGNEVLDFNADEAKKLWEKADKISKFSGTFEIAFNADGGHQGWVEAVVNQLKNNLGIDAQAKAFPKFDDFRKVIVEGSINSAFRTGWRADYPGLYNFLGPLYATGAGSNDGKYSNPEFDKKIATGIAESDEDKRNELLQEAQTILFKDLPAIPLWYSNVVGGYSNNVDNVEFGWDSMPIYAEITVK